MSHGISTEMIKVENRNGVASKPMTRVYVVKEEFISEYSEYESEEVNDTRNFNMCLSQPKVVLDKNVVAQYLKTKKVPSNSSTLSSSQTIGNNTKMDSEGESTILVNAGKNLNNFKNRLSVRKDLINKSMSTQEKEVILEGPMFSRNNNLFENINGYIARQSIDKSSRDESLGRPMFSRNNNLFININEYNTQQSTHNATNSQILNNDLYKACDTSAIVNHQNFENNTVTIDEDSMGLECGDDILFAHSDGHNDENGAARHEELEDEMECGDDILFIKEVGNSENPESVTVESDGMECGDDILFTEGAGYYNSDEESGEENQEYSPKDAQINTSLPIGPTKQEAEIEITDQSEVIDEFLEVEDVFYECEKCHYKTSDEQELQNHVATQHSDVSPSVERLVGCDKCNEAFENLPLLKEHQIEKHGLKYFYTCKFCPSTSWYGHTLKKHIETYHSRELDKENINDIMKSILLCKRADMDNTEIIDLDDLESDEVAEKERVVTVHLIQKVTSKPNKKQYISYTEAKQFLKVFCTNCKATPKSSRKRILQYCSLCFNLYSYRCRKCNNIYSSYNTAWKHSKFFCNPTPAPRRPIVTQKKTQQYELTATLQERLHHQGYAGSEKFYKAFCVECKEYFLRRDHKNSDECIHCNNYLEYQCDICSKFYKYELSAQRHALKCHKGWRFNVIRASLNTLALLDHNYYSTSNIANDVVDQPPFTEPSHKHQSARKVYTGRQK